MRRAQGWPSALSSNEPDHRHHQTHHTDDERDEQRRPDRGGRAFRAAGLGRAVVKERQREQSEDGGDRTKQDGDRERGD